MDRVKRLDTYEQVIKLKEDLQVEKRAAEKVDSLKEELMKGVRESMENLKCNEIKQLVNQMSDQSARISGLHSSNELMTKSIGNIQVEMLKTLKAISQGQLAFAEHYAKRNPIPGDEVINKKASTGVDAAGSYSHTYNVPSGYAFYLTSLAVTSNKTTSYEVLIDGKYDPALTEPLQQFGGHQQIYDPPEKAYSEVILKVTNNSAVQQTYNFNIKGFIRREP